MKKLSLLLSILFLFTSISLNVSAASTYDIIPDEVVGVLTSNTGDSIEVIGKKVTKARSLGTWLLGQKEASYEFEVNPYSTAVYTRPATEYDTSGYIRATLTIKYREVTDSLGTSTYLLQEVSGSWDNVLFGVTVINADLTYGCVALGVNSTQYEDIKGVRNNFRYSTGFTTYIPDTFGIMGANLFLDLEDDYANQWSFHIQNNLFNNHIVV